MEISLGRFQGIDNEQLLSINGGWSLEQWGTAILIVSAIVAAGAMTGGVGAVVGISAAVGGGFVVGSW
ncbi:MAG: hypothetical protein JWM44_2561 [Bacilli bacterium]|nr:hypothetical protein [Bacilli bacterium]